MVHERQLGCTNVMLSRFLQCAPECYITSRLHRHGVYPSIPINIVAFKNLVDKNVILNQYYIRLSFSVMAT